MKPRFFHTFFILLFLFSVARGFSQSATDTNLSPAQIEGRALAQEILAQRPETNSTATGLLKIRDEKGIRTETPMRFDVVVTETNWMSVYEKALPTNGPGFFRLEVAHDTTNTNRYEMTFCFTNGATWMKDKSEAVQGLPFAGDFLAVDLGLDFFHWPEQKILKHEMKRGRSCTVLESTNPNPNAIPNLPGYSRVVSWIDNDNSGIVHAEAFDANDKLLKEFDPKGFKKVNGQWQLQSMEMDNVQTGSRTRIEFNLGQ